MTRRFKPDQEARIVELMRQGKRPGYIAAALHLDHGRVVDKVAQLRMRHADLAEPTTEARMRRCLGPGCGVMFASDGPGNRLCRRCGPIVAGAAPLGGRVAG